MKHGGNKGGRPKGSKGKNTLDKEAARARVRELVIARIDPLTEAQIRNATGISHLMLRDPKTGKFERVTDEAGIDAALASEGQAVWIYTKDPSVQAFTDLMNRALDKPQEQPQEIKVTGTLNIATRLAEGRKRLAKRG